MMSGVTASIYFFVEPGKMLYYMFMPLLHVFLHGNNIIITAYIQRMFPTELRGTLTSITTIISQIGLLIFNVSLN